MTQQDTSVEINAFIDVFRVEGATGGPLFGKTVAVKDLFDVAGYVTGCGNPMWRRTHPEARKNAWSVDALLRAGACLVGKAHTDELAYSLMGVNTHYGTPLNSADPRRVPGGSSSGSAAAVAAGLADLGLGTDTGGSVRMPASFCGLWGLRTTFGQVSVDGVMPFTRSFDTVGWMAQDGALMAAAAEALGCSEGVPVTRLLLPVDVWARADAATIAAVAPVLADFQARFGTAVPVRLAKDGLDTWREAFRICQAGEVWECLGAWVSSHEPGFGPGIKDRFEMAAGIARTEFAAEDARRQVIRAQMRELVAGGAVLVMPTSPAPAPFLSAPEAEQADFRTRALEMLCPAGLSGLPQLTIPAGTVDGGPVGLSLIGAERQDRSLIAAALEAGL